MSFLGFGGNYNRPGPGINKDEPGKKGFALLFDILGREFWGLWALNFYYLLACLPIITIGQATIAMYRVVITMMRDENVYVRRDFFTAFKKNFKVGIAAGIPITILFISGIYLNFSLLLGILSNTASTFTIVMMFFWTLFTVSSVSYILPMLAYVDLPFMPLIKNAVFLMFLGKFRTIGMVLLTVGAYSLILIYMPVTMPVIMFGGFFSLLTFLNAFLAWPVINKFVLNNGAQENVETENEVTINK